MTAKFVFNEPGMTELTKSWTGTFGTHIHKQSEKLVLLGKGSAGFDTGKLVADIRGEYGHSDGGSLEAKVGANPDGVGTGYGLYNHEGTRPHLILPHTAKALRFRIGGMVVFANRVMHPGTRATKFLTKWLNDLFG